MELSRWRVSAKGKMGKEVSPAADRSFHIVCLDDHQLFHTAISEYCIKPFFPVAKLERFTNGDIAYQYIKTQIDLRQRIDLFITDINHPGLRGDQLIRKIRDYEHETSFGSRIPVVVITMMEYAFVPGLVGAGLDLVDCYFSKTAEASDIVDGLEDILY